MRALMPDYLDNFGNIPRTTASPSGKSSTTILNWALAIPLNQWWASKKFSTGYGFAEVTQDFVDEFEAGDPGSKFTQQHEQRPYFYHL